MIPIASPPPKAITVMIVDDEESARNRLAKLIGAYSSLRVIATAGGVVEGAAAFELHRPQLVFLDVEMNDGTGFDLLPFLNPVPKVIFVTAHERFAVKAFEVGAVDYLLKPVFANRLEIALKRILQTEQTAPETSPAPFQPDDMIFLRTSEGSVAVAVSDIAYIEAERNFSFVHASGDRKVMIYRTLGQWEQRLPETSFFRIDRSIMVNVQRIEKVSSAGLSSARLHLSGIRNSLDIGRSAYRRLRSKIEH